MSYENEEHINRGIQGFQAEIEDLTQRVEASCRTISELKQSIEFHLATIRRLEDDARHREEQDNWRKVTGLRGF